jgi:hypothetical protein
MWRLFLSRNIETQRTRRIRASDASEASGLGGVSAVMGRCSQTVLTRARDHRLRAEKLVELARCMQSVDPERFQVASDPDVCGVLG